MLRSTSRWPQNYTAIRRLSTAVTIAVIVVGGVALKAESAPILFDLRGTEGLALDGAGSGTSITVSGLMATFSHNDPGSGVFNQTASAFGVNAAASGDSTDELDDGAGFEESISITFDQPVFLKGLVVSSFGSGSDQGVLSLNGGALADTLQKGAGNTLTNAGVYSNVAPQTASLIGALIPAGSDITVAFDNSLGGNGFSFDNFTVEVVPEPSTVLLVGFGLVIAGGLCRRT